MNYSSECGWLAWAGLPGKVLSLYQMRMIANLIPVSFITFGLGHSFGAGFEAFIVTVCISEKQLPLEDMKEVLSHDLVVAVATPA